MKGIVLVSFALLVVSCIGLPVSPQGEEEDIGSRYPGPRLIETAPGVRQWLNYDQVLKLALNNVGFVDVTDFPNEKPIAVAPHDYPTSPQQEELFQEIVQYADVDSWSATVNTLASYTNRHCQTVTGRTSAEWIASRFRQLATGRNDVDVSFFNTTGFDQPSVIAVVEGNGPNADEIVVYGGHEDSISSGNTAPGADDDASGTAAILEVFGALMAANYRPSRSIHFMTYACEELGLIGSAQIARSYRSENQNVYAVLQHDMIGWRGQIGEYGLVTDFTDGELNDFVRMITDDANYTSLAWTNTRCNYQCSDHASWTNQGYPAVFTFESPMGNSNPYIHTPSDTFNRLNPPHAFELVKLALGFILELST